MANLNGYHGHLVRRIVADLEFLKESEQLSTDDFAAILARLPRSERVIVPAPPTNGLVLELGGNFGGMGMGMPQAANIQRKMPPPLPGRAMVPTIDPATIGIDTRCRCRATFAYPMGQVSPFSRPFDTRNGQLYRHASWMQKEGVRTAVGRNLSFRLHPVRHDAAR